MIHDLPASEWAAGHRSLLKALKAAPSGLSWCARHTEFVDGILHKVWAQVTDEIPHAGRLAIVATGGYGRRELSPHSDIDVTVVPEDESLEGIEEAVRRIFLGIQTEASGIGLDVGYAYRLATDCPGLDAKTRSGLLDARLVAGSPKAFQGLVEAFWDTFPVGEFLVAKLMERKQAFARYNDTPLVVEPELKHGAGGLRCFHTANWIGQAIGARQAKPDAAFDFVLLLRNILHMTSGRKVDLLSRARQEQVSECLRMEMLPLMAKCAEQGELLYQRYLDAVETLHESRYLLSSGIVAVRGEARLLEGCSASTAAQGIAVATALGLKVRALPRQSMTMGDGALILRAFASGEQTVRNLQVSGLMDALLPELERCRTLMPNDALHQFTVYEHTLRLIRNLDALRTQSGWLAEIYGALPNTSPLYLACLLHDVGKSHPAKPHSESGADTAREVCARWDLDPRVAGTVSWLVENHLVMAHTMRMRDVNRPETIREFAEIVQSRERLAMLTLLTSADVRAVSEESWTPVQESFLRQLYESTLNVLESPESELDSAEDKKGRIRRRLKHVPLDTEKLTDFVERLPAHYLLGTAADVIAEHFQLVEAARDGKSGILARARHDLSATELTVCTRDRAGLLSSVLAVLYAFDLDITALRASTTTDAAPIALDTFTVTFADQPLPPATLRHVEAALQGVIEGRVSPDELLRSKGKDPERSQHVFDYTFLPGHPGILEIRAPRGKGMAYRVSRLIARHGWNIHSARVGQWAGRGAAAFYLEGVQPEDIEAALAGQV